VDVVNPPASNEDVTMGSGKTQSTSTLDYARPGSRLCPTRHHPLTAWAWSALILETAYRGTLITIAYIRSPTYPWERFDWNVGDSASLQRIGDVVLLIGIVLAVFALLPRGFKRWGAALALAGLLLVFATKGILLNDLHNMGINRARE
jgi:hypothetical protein